MLISLFLLSLFELAIAGDIVQYNGYVVDYYCWLRNGRIGLDGAELGTDPGDHSTHCMRDVAPCIANGYMVVEEKVNGPYTYDLKYRFDSTGNDLMFDIVDTTSKNWMLRVTVVGEEMDNNFIAVSSLKLENTISEPITDFPTTDPTVAPSLSPTTLPPTAIPSIAPTTLPTPLPGDPTAAPVTAVPTVAPSSSPTTSPSTAAPTDTPSTNFPTLSPTNPPVIEGNGLSYRGKVATGVIVGTVGAIMILLSMTMYASGVEDGSIDQGAVRVIAVRLLSFLSCVGAIISIVLIFEWARDNTDNDSNFLGKLNWQDNVFAYHPVLMTCFVMGQIIAISTWILIPNRSFAKLLHGMLQMGSLVCMITAFVAIVKDRREVKFATFTTIHSWVGVAAICMFGLTYVWGGCMAALTFLSPNSVVIKHVGLVLFHRSFGMLTMVLCISALCTGVMDRLSEGLCFYELGKGEVYGTIEDSAVHYSGMPHSCKIAYGSTVAALAAAALMVLAVSYRGTSLPDEDTILSRQPDPEVSITPTKQAPVGGSTARFQIVGVASSQRDEGLPL